MAARRRKETMQADVRGFDLEPRPKRVGRLAELQVRVAVRLRLGFYGSAMRYGLRRDLRAPLERPNAKIPMAIRPLAAVHIPALLSSDDAHDNPEEIVALARRRWLVRRAASRCFVAVDLRNERPCYAQWLLGPADNRLIRRLGRAPALHEGEALLEEGFTPARYRRLGIAPAANARIAAKARDVGAQHVLTFVERQSTEQLEACARAGFFPYVLHERRQIGFGLITQDLFEELPHGELTELGRP